MRSPHQTHAPDRAALSAYAREGLGGDAVYRGYRPKKAQLDQVAQMLPTAHVVVVSAGWCPDCRREVPKMARIVEQLPPGWTVELRGDEQATRTDLGVRAIPTFVVFDRSGGHELGRIIESPDSPHGLEGDLVAIAETASRSETVA